MFNVCPGCGVYNADKLVEPGSDIAVCRACGHQHTFFACRYSSPMAQAELGKDWRESGTDDV